jgi:hypothetical protein
MNCGLELLGQLSEIGATIEPAGDKLIVRAGTRPIPAELVVQIREAKAGLLVVLGEAMDWRARQQEALAHWRTLHPPGQAAELAGCGKKPRIWQDIGGTICPAGEMWGH